MYLFDFTNLDASNTTLKEEYILPISIHCQANSNVFCHYTWTDVDNSEKVASSNGTLDLASHGHGQYQCRAVCDIGGFKCEVYPHLVEYRCECFSLNLDFK